MICLWMFSVREASDEVLSAPFGEALDSICAEVMEVELL